MRQEIILGSGGTGSYYVPHSVRYAMNDTSTPIKFTLLDGDEVEERNLLRQGFFPHDLGKVKAFALRDRLVPICPAHIQLEAHCQFVNTVDDIIRYVEPSATHVMLVCCVDNNMARLRLHLAAYAIHDMGKQVEVIDSGNSEWTGQVIPMRLMRRNNSFLSGLHAASKTGIEGVRQFCVKGGGSAHKIASVFTPNADWRDRLNRGEHELGCQDHVVANPQNIATNMLAGATLLQAKHALLRGQTQCGIYRFDAKTNSVQMTNTPAIEEGYAERITDILAYLQTEEGFQSIFGSQLRITQSADGSRAVSNISTASTVPTAPIAPPENPTRVAEPVVAVVTETATQVVPPIEVVSVVEPAVEPIIEPTLTPPVVDVPVVRPQAIVRSPRRNIQFRSVSASLDAVDEILNSSATEVSDDVIDDLLSNLAQG